MLQAFLVAPVFALVFLMLRGPAAGAAGCCGCSAAPRRWWCRRAGIWLLVALWPAQSRPYIGGSQTNSILELALGYNGLGRLTGDETGGLGNMNHDVGWGRLLGGEMGGADRLAAARGADRRGGRPVARRDGPRAPTRSGPRLLLWGGWLVVTAAIVQLHERHRASLLHGGAGARGGGGRGHRRRHCSGNDAPTFGRRPRWPGIVLITVVLSFRSAAGKFRVVAVAAVGRPGGRRGGGPAVDRRRALVRIGRDGVGRRRGSGRACRTRGLLAGHRRHPAYVGPSRRRAPARASADRRDSSTPAGPAPR